MSKIVIKFLQGRTGAQIIRCCSKFLVVCKAVSYENRLTHIKVMREDEVGALLRHHVDTWYLVSRGNSQLVCGTVTCIVDAIFCVRHST